MMQQPLFPRSSVMTKLPLSPEWIVGFTDGEGSFSVTMDLGHPKRVRSCIRVRTKFELGQKNRAILEKVRDYFGFGIIVPHSSKPGNFQYVALTNADCRAIVRFFSEHPLHIKNNDFAKWAYIINKIQNRRDQSVINDEDILEIAKIRDTMNLTHNKCAHYRNFDAIKKMVAQHPHIHPWSYSKEELDVIREKWQFLSDKEIGKIISHTARSVKRIRCKLRLFRPSHQFKKGDILWVK